MRVEDHGRLSRRMLLAGAGGSVFAGPAQAQGQPVEVVHWWVSGGESDAIRTIRRRVEAGGRVWIDTAVQGPDLAKTAALTRVLGGNPPTVMLWHVGKDLADLARDEVIRDVQAAAEGWDAALPPEIASRLKIDGKYVAVPADLHCGNWTFANLGLLRAASIEAPTSWPAVLQVCSNLRRSGVLPVAFGGQAWQEASVFAMS